MTPWMWMEAMQWAAIVLIAILAAGVLYLVADLHRRLGPDLGAMVPNDGLAVGTAAPDFAAEDPRTGQPIRLSDFDGRRVVVAFVASNCPPCRKLVPDLNRFARDRHDTSVVAVATDGAGMDYAREFSERIAVVGDAGKAIQQAFEVSRTPLVYLLDEERKVANRTVSSSLIDLEDTLDGFGKPQGNAAWVAVPEPNEPTTRVRGESRSNRNRSANHG
jgi:methylamine dehydrogenase accessory protein MauD